MKYPSSHITLLGLAVISYGFSNALLRYFSNQHSGIELAFWLSLATMTTILLSRGRSAVRELRINNLRTAWLFLAFQSMAFLAFVLAIDLAPAPLVGAILPVEGIVAACLAAVVLREKVRLKEGLYIAGGALGAALLATSAADAPLTVHYGLLAALASAALYGCAMIALRQAAKADTIIALTFWACMPVMIISAPFGISAISPEALALFAISLVVKPIADLSYTAGVSRAPIALASSTLPMIGMSTAGFAWIMMGEAPSIQAVAAAIIIAVCAAMLVRISILRSKADAEPA